MEYSVIDEFKVKTADRIIEVARGQIVTLNPEKAAKLIKKGKIRPMNTELMPVSDETMKSVYLETMHRINDNYIEGTIKYIRDNHPVLDAKINNADDQINEIWNDCNEGKKSVDDFAEALKAYQDFFLEAIELYNSKNS